MRVMFQGTSANRLLGAAFTLAASLACGIAPCAAASLHVTWASNTEADLAGYRLRYGTSAGAYTETIEAGLANSCDVPGLQQGLLYYFALYAYDQAGNVSAPSAEITARIPAGLTPSPVVESASETSTGSVFFVRGRSSVAMILGGGFQPGSTVDAGPGLTAGQVLLAAGKLLVPFDVAPAATLGSRTVTVTNPDQGVGSRSDALSIVRNPDINADCSVDALDLNSLARAWNETGDEARYIPEADLDGDGYIGPDDLTVFVQYFGRIFPGCP